MTPGTSFIAPAQNPLKKSAISTDSKPKKRLMNGIGGFLARMRADSSGSVESHQNYVEKENIDDRVSTNCNSPRTTNNVTQRLREVHTTEQIDTLIRLDFTYIFSILKNKFDYIIFAFCIFFLKFPSFHYFLSEFLS